jgi:hypothetical protein
MKFSTPVFLTSLCISLLIGGAIGFFAGVASTNAGMEFLENMVSTERLADIKETQKINRDKFKFEFPGNWSVNKHEDDYDPDTMFSVDSPGSTYVLFMFDDVETEPSENLQQQVEAFSNLMGKVSTSKYNTYGKLKGEGAIVKGKIFGLKVTVKIFTTFIHGTSVIIVQQSHDEDLRYVKNGLDLIETTFQIKPINHSK